MKNSRNASASGNAIIILFLVTSLFHIRQLWGINLPVFYSDIVLYVLCGLAFIAVIPPITAKIVVGLDRLESFMRRSGVSRNTMYISFAILFSALCLHFRSDTTFLGDGHLRTNQLTFGRWFLPTEFLDFFLHAAFFNLILKPLGYSSLQCYQIFSSLCGLVFIIGIWKLANRLFKRSVITAFLLLISSGVAAFFFGYVESYSLVTCFVPFVIIAGIDALDNAKRTPLFILFCIIAALIHAAAIFILTPVLVYVILINYAGEKLKISSISKTLAGGIIATVLIIYFVRIFFETGIERYILPIIPGDNSPQALLTVRHLLNIVNWMCLAALPAPVIIALIVKSKETLGDTQRRPVSFAVWIIIPAFLFILFFTPQLGGPRDWDLFAFAFFIILIALLIPLSVYSRKTIPASILPVVLVSIILTGSMVGINSSIAKSTDRFAEIIEVSKFNNLFKEYNLLNAYAGDHPEISNRRLEFALMAWEQPPPKKSDSTLILNKLGDYYITENKPDEAKRYLNLSLATDPYNILTYHHLINYHRSFGTKDNLLEIADTMSTRFPSSAKAQMDAGVLFMQLNQNERGRACLKKAYMLDSNDVFVIVNYANLFMHDKNYPTSVRLLKRAVAINPDYFKANYNLALAYIGINAISEAQLYLKHATQLATTQREIDNLQQLRDILGKTEIY